MHVEFFLMHLIKKMSVNGTEIQKDPPTACSIIKELSPKKNSEKL